MDVFGFAVKILHVIRRLLEDIVFSNTRIMDSQPSIPWILTPFNYVDWREDMEFSLHNKGYFRITLGREVEPHHLVEKKKFLKPLR